MKALIFFLTSVLFAPVTNLQAQANSTYKYRGSYPQYYFVRTVSGLGIIPTTSIQVIDKDGRSISYSFPDRGRNKSMQLSTTDSLINSLEMCATCKIVKTKDQIDLMYRQITGISPAFLLDKCPAGYGQATYAWYQRSNATYVPLWLKFSKGCGRTAEHNKLINDYISEFERPGDTVLLKKLNQAFVAKQNKPIPAQTNTNYRSAALPDTIVKMAREKNAEWITEYLYHNKRLYTIYYPLSHEQRERPYIDNPYYDETGRVILIHTSAIQSMFTRGEHWYPNSVKDSEVTSLGHWQREKNNYIKH